MSAVKYQVMPPLSPEEYQDLYESIREHGVLEPIHIDADGVVIDGHHRSKIAAELGIPCPMVAHDDLDEAGKRSLAFTLNLKRRHLNREQRRALIAESLKADPALSNLEHSRRTGASDKTVASVRSELESHSEIPNDIPRINSRGQERPASYERSASQPRREPEPEPEQEADPWRAPGEQTPESEPLTTGDLPQATAIPQHHLDELNTQPAPEPEPRAEAITSQFTSAVVELNRVMNRFERIKNDSNFPRNKEKVAALHRHDLTRTINELQALVDQLS
ncbi:ParB N-terminal domain-containing protein [Corynebacterium phoceense]|uniref:ParB N-terminal domain-containing protein n=1 Tax=Corynebacterium phoceense TaxID=1686286 RepID=UPI000839CD88|nr:ParB N-terminal domain-containing protein [Corynebacterium phoceense]